MFARSWNSAHSGMDMLYASYCCTSIYDAKKFGGSVQELVVRSSYSAAKLIELLVNNFSSYNDTAEYKGRKG